jgi:hypothetical protein
MITNLTLTSATTNAAAPFTFGHAFKQGDVPAGSQVVAGFANFQCAPKNAWPDGSLKFAVLSGRAALTANAPLAVALSIGTPNGGTALTTADLKATGITASIAAGAFGTVSWATTDWDAPFMAWVSGPQMSSWIYRKAVGSDAHLVGWLEVRLYADGAVEVLPWIENGYLMVAAPANKSATYAFTLGGVERFSAAIDLPNHCRTPLVSGTAVSHWLGTDPAVMPAHDSAYLQSTLIVPTYSVAASTTVLNSQSQTFAPLQAGNHQPAMGSGGYSPAIGLIPEWDVAYLTTGDARAYRGLVFNAYGAGRYGIHFRDENTNRPVRFSQRPTVVLGDNNGVRDIGSSTANVRTPNATGTLPQSFASSHHPSLGPVAYLVTGQLYHLETAQFVATVNYLKNGDASRYNADGILQSAVGSNTVRGAAWAWRSLAQAAAVTPDDDPLSAELIASFSANVSWYHARYVALANNPQGFISPYNDYSPTTRFNIAVTAGATTMTLPPADTYEVDGLYVGYELFIRDEVRIITAYTGATNLATLASAFTFTSASESAELRNENIWFESSWQQDFFTAATGYSKSIGVRVSSPVATKLTEFFAWKAQSIVGRFGTAAATEFLYRDAAQYIISAAPSNSANWINGAGPWYANWGQIYAASSPSTAREIGDGSLRGGNFPESSSYWGNLQPALAYAVQHGVTGAPAAYARMIGASNYNLLAADMAVNPVWAVTARDYIAEDATVTTPGPSLILDSAPLLGANTLVLGPYQGHGAPLSAIASSGSDGASAAYDMIESGDNPLSEMRIVVEQQGTHGTFVPDDVCGGVYTGDGTYDTVALGFYVDGAYLGNAPQYFGTPTTTPVSADLAATYAIRALVGANLSATYSIETTATVFADLAATYAIGVLVFADLPATYSIGMLVHADLTATYAVQSDVVYARAPAGDGYKARRVIVHDRPTAD